MLGIFKLKKKSKKEKEQQQDDEKENSSSPTKVKKVEKSKKDSKSKKGQPEPSPVQTKPQPPSQQQVTHSPKQQQQQKQQPEQHPLDGMILDRRPNSPPISSQSQILNSPTHSQNQSVSSPKKGYDQQQHQHSPQHPHSPKSNGIHDQSVSGMNGEGEVNQDELCEDMKIMADKVRRRSLRQLKQQQQQQSEQQELTVDTNTYNNHNDTLTHSQIHQQVSPLSSKSAATTINIQTQQPRAPVLSASDATQTSSFVRGNFLSSTISGSDLHRFLNSGYLHGDGYLQRGVELKYPKSPHFHRPPNFSYSKNGPNYVTPRSSTQHRGAMRALLMSASSSDAPRSSRLVYSRGRSSSPTQHQRVLSGGGDNKNVTPVVTATQSIPVTRNPDNEEPIRLSKFSGGYEPDPHTPRKIESLDWPAPPYPAAVPELRARSRSSSNKRAPSTVTSIHGAGGVSVNGDDDDDDENDSDNDEEVVEVLRNHNQNNLEYNANRQSAGGASVSSSLARAKASRPNSKMHYQNRMFDDDYNDYLLQLRPDKEWRKVLYKSNRGNKRNQSGDSTCENNNNTNNSNYGDFNNNTSDQRDHNDEILNENDDEEEEERKKVAATPINLKLQRELDEISKIENESSMAAAVIREVKAQQKSMINHKLKLDPWKASRTPSANIEPAVRTRFESPVNASPSRVINYNRSSTLTSTASGHTLSGAPMSSTTFFGADTSLMSPTSQNSATLQSSTNPLSATLIASNPLSPHINKADTLPNQSNVSTSSMCSSSYLTKANYINSSSRIISSSSTPKAVPKPGYGLASPKKSITLPNSSRYIGLSTHRSVDFENPTFSVGSYYTTNDIKSHQEITPELDNYKIYPYEELKINKKKKLPIDVDRQRLERHLSPQDFEKVFEMTLQQFYELSEWKRVELKKKAKLF